jgi:glycosyltransferase involved in cell wall biosynthesis
MPLPEVCAAWAEAQIPVIRNGRDLPVAWRDPEPTVIQTARVSLRAELGIHPASLVALTVARLSAPKGHLDLLGAIRLLPESYADVHFVWAGTGWERDRLETAIAAAGLSGRVHLTGYRTDVPALLHASDLFVFPSHSEGYSLAVIGAMSAGLPIIAADGSSLPEQLGDGQYGLLFPAGDPAALAERLSYALSHPARMRALADAARLVSRTLTEEAMCTAMLSLVTPCKSRRANLLCPLDTNGPYGCRGHGRASRPVRTLDRACHVVSRQREPAEPRTEADGNPVTYSNRSLRPRAKRCSFCIVRVEVRSACPHRA